MDLRAPGGGARGLPVGWPACCGDSLPSQWLSAPWQQALGLGALPLGRPVPSFFCLIACSCLSPKAAASLRWRQPTAMDGQLALSLGWGAEAPGLSPVPACWGEGPRDSRPLPFGENPSTPAKQWCRPVQGCPLGSGQARELRTSLGAGRASAPLPPAPPCGAPVLLDCRPTSHHWLLQVPSGAAGGMKEVPSSPGRQQVSA